MRPLAQRSPRHADTARRLCVGLALLGLLAACGGTPPPSAQLPPGNTLAPDLPFPEFEEAEAFLQMQRRLRAAQGPADPPPRFGPHSQRVLRTVQRQQRLAAAELQERARREAVFKQRLRQHNQAEWDALQGRVAQEEALEVLREETRSRNRTANRRRFQGRYDLFRNRLSRLEREAEARARLVEQNRFRNQERVLGQLEELRRRQNANLRLPGAGVGPEQGDTAAPPAGTPQEGATAPAN